MLNMWHTLARTLSPQSRSLASCVRISVRWQNVQSIINKNKCWTVEPLRSILLLLSMLSFFPRVQCYDCLDSFHHIFLRALCRVRAAACVRYTSHSAFAIERTARIRCSTFRCQLRIFIIKLKFFFPLAAWQSENCVHARVVEWNSRWLKAYACISVNLWTLDICYGGANPCRDNER